MPNKSTFQRSLDGAFERLEDRRCCAAVSAGWDGPGKGSADLTYFVGSTPSGLSNALVESAIKTALDAWAKVADVHFTETKTPGLARSLDFTFGNIDGSGGTLAQAYFPADVNQGRIAGDVQFDSSEKWEVGNALGSAAFDLVRVAVHEIGHALGLEHSSQSNAILAPSISPTESFSKLAPNDIDAILSLYAPAKASAGTQTIPPISSNPPTNSTPSSTTGNTTPTPNSPGGTTLPTPFRTIPHHFFTRAINFFTSSSAWTSILQSFRSASKLTNALATPTTENTSTTDGTVDLDGQQCNHSIDPISVSQTVFSRGRFRF